MARAYLLSHGSREADKNDTFVPAGRTIAFFSEFDTNVLRLNGLAALSGGDYSPTETKVGPCPVSNYRHTKFEDFAIAQHLASESSASDGQSYYVGQDLPSPVYLCSNPAKCRTTYPQHADDCTGVFKLLAEQDIYSVACRGVRGQAGTTDNKLDGTTELLDEMRVEAQRILAWAKTDEMAAMEHWQSLTQATRVALGTSYIPLREYAAKYFAGGGESTPEAVLEARRYLEAYDDATFYSWVATMDENGRQWQLIMTDPDLAAAYQRGWGIVDPRGALFDGTTPQAGDPVLAMGAQIDEQATDIASAVAQFTGSEEDDVATVSAAYGALMNDVTAYQNSVGQDRASAAAALYHAGAAVGVALQLHLEQHDTDSLAGLVSAVDLLCQWGRSLTTV